MSVAAVPTQSTDRDGEGWAQEASRAFLESAPDAVVIIDVSGQVILVNAQTEAMFGYPRSDLVGQPVEVLLPERFRDAHVGHLARYAGEPATRAMGAGFELFGRRADGSEFPIDISLSPLATGGKVLFAAAVRDSTDRLRAAAKFGSFLESAPDAVVVIETDGRMALVNAQTERLFGYPRDKLVGSPVEMLLPDRFRGSHIGHRATYVQEPRTRAMGAGLDLYGQRADGTEFPIDISLAPLETEEGRLIAATVRDVTERKRLESARDEFIHHAAHELRTPLATLAALGETLALRMGEMSPGHIAEALGALKRQGERASTLVANLLDLTQLEGGHADLRLAEVTLRPTIERVLEAAPAPEGKTVTTEVTGDVVLVADQMLLERVLTNLLTNAYRYGGSQVRVRARSMGGEVVIEVADDGDGVAADLLPRVFDPFVRGKTAGAVGGSGVGLALCRRIIQTLHGSIDYDGTGDGACFTIRMPVSR